MTTANRARGWRLALAVALVGLLPGAARAGERAFAIDPEASSLEVSVFRAGLLSGLAHDHTIAAREISGRVVLDLARPAAGSVSLEAPARALAVADANVSDDDRRSIEESMKGEVLEVEKFPTISFRSTGVEALEVAPGRLKVKVRGDLTLHGVTRAVEVPVDLLVEGTVLRAAGSVPLKQTDHGIKPFQAALGSITVKDEVKVSFRIIAKVEPAPR